MIIKNTNTNTIYRPSFYGGLTNKMRSEINNVDISKIKHYLGDNNLESEFKNNKFIAWSVLKVFEFLQKLKAQYKINIALPKNILVEDLNKLNIQNPHGTYAFSNLVPCRLNNSSDEVTPAMSIIFNQDFPWHKINEISDIEYSSRNTCTDFFLESFFHEFSHIAHEGHLLKKYGVKQTLHKLVSLTDDKIVARYKNQFNESVSNNVCTRAGENPLELIGCDMSKRFIENMDRNNIEPIRNPCENSPYQCLFKLRNLFKDNNTLDTVINRFFNGKTEWLKNHKIN